MPRFRRRIPRSPAPPLRPTAALTLLAALLAVAAALVGHRSGQETAQLVEARGRLALVLAAQADARLGALRAAAAETLAAPQAPDAPSQRDALAQALGRGEPALAGLALEPGPPPEAPRDAVRPGPDGAARIALDLPRPAGRGTLTLFVDAGALAADAQRPQGLELLFAARGGALAPATPGADAAGRAAARTLRALAADAREAGALAQRELDAPGGGRLLAVAAPLRSEPLTLLLLVPAPRDHGPPVGMTAILLALAGTALAVLPLLRKKRRQP